VTRELLQSGKRVILGSGSPRRLELLAQIGIEPFSIIHPDIDETPYRSELPRVYCNRMAWEKSNAIPTNDEDVLLTADTTVAFGRRIFGKPENEKQAAEFLLALSGRRHRVITSIAVKYQKKILERYVISTVKMKAISNLELNSYLMTEDWKGKAGGYGLQGPAAAFVPWIQGSFSGIIGLPLVETANLLRAVGVNVAFV